MITIQEYLLSKSKSRLNMIKATDDTIHQIVKDELDRLGHDADLNHIDVSEVTSMDGLFSCDIGDNLGPKYKDLNPDISRWNVSNVKIMYYMFCGCENFTQEISEWDVSNVKDMRGMFFGCEKFNGDISKWDVSNVTLMESMFGQCGMFNCNISKWDVSNVENMTNMFWGCKRFNQDLSKWDVSNLKRCDWIFDDCLIKYEFLPKIKITFKTTI